MLEYITILVNSAFESMKSFVCSILDVDSSIKLDISTDVIERTSNGRKVATPVMEKNLSNRMTSLFKNTRVLVSIINSKEPNAYTIPGVFIFDPSRWYMVVFYPLILSGVGYFLVFFLQVFEQYLRGTYRVATKTTITYDPRTKKIDCSLTDVQVYITNKLVSMLSYEEIEAVLLHEVGHNMSTFYAAIENTAKLPYVAGVSLLIFGTLMAYYTIHQDVLKMYGQILIISSSCFLMMIFSYFIQSYTRRRQEIWSDEFAITCGRGKELESALKKMYHWVDVQKKRIESKNINFLAKGFRTIGRVIHFIIEKIYGPQYPSEDERLQMIRDKQYMDVTQDDE